MYLDKEHPVPVYLQLKELLQNQIEQGVYLSHQKLPSERDLCKHHSLSRMTARRALQSLIDEGFAYTRIGKGTFVSDRSHSGNGTSGETAQSISVTYQQLLTEQLLSFDCAAVEKTINEALATISAEILALKIFPALIRQFEAQWQQGRISLLAQQYTTTTLYTQLVCMMNAATPPPTGPRVLLACATHDDHEIGSTLLALSLKRRGFRVTYLGRNSMSAEFLEIVQAVQPRLVCVSAATGQAGQSVADQSRPLATDLATIKMEATAPGQAQPIFAFGGTAFDRNAPLRAATTGLYLGPTILQAVSKIQQVCDA